MVGFFTAEGRGDADAAAVQLAGNGIWAQEATQDPCYRAHPCTDAAGIRAGLQFANAQHQCLAVIELNVASAVVTGRFEVRNDAFRGIGLEHAFQSFMALVPQDKITFLANVLDTDSVPLPWEGNG